MAGPWIDTWDRTAVLSAYRAEFERAEPDPGYTGDVGACVAGTTSRAFRDSELQRINWYRRMAGVDVVAESAGSTVAAQHAALMMAAAGDLSHEPSPSWPCYSASGADGASKSNLGLGNAGVAAVDAYVRDGGSGNESVGHRGWVLSPYARAVGMGAAFGSSSANALHVLGDLTGSPDRLREVRGFVARPPPGYVPAAAVFRRWSFRVFGDFDFSAASVAVVGDGGPVRIDIVHRGDASSHLPRPALVWELADVPTHSSMPEPAGGDECYTVTINGVRAGGAAQEPYEYATCLLGLSIESPAAGDLIGPQNLRAVDVGHDAVTLSWGLATQPGGVSVRSYVVERLRGGEWVELHSSPSAITGLVVRGLRPSTEYRFRVRLDTTAGDASGTVTATTTRAPPASDAGVGITDGDEFDVRIVARRVPSGRVEFALQQQEPDGGWSRRLLPSQRFFPLDTRVGHWLVSTPLAVGGAADGDPGDGPDVWIVARRVASGRVEFGLQRQETDGGWGERLLPRQRFFPVGTRIGRWLVSTPLTVGASSAPANTAADLPPSIGVDSTAPTTTTQPTVDPHEELASLVLAGANARRGGLMPLALDDGLSAAARARAQAQARSGDWRNDFDYGPLLASTWGFWLAGKSAYTGSDFDSLDVAQALSDLLLDEREFGALHCEPCTRLGVGAATAGGRTYGTVVVAGPPPTAAEVAAAEAEMVGLVNRLRAGLGLGELVRDSDIAAVARRWSEQMSADGRLYHNPDFFEQYPGRPESGAENASRVDLRTSGGVGSLGDAIGRSFDRLVASPGHYANLVDPVLTHLGVGIVVDGTAVWITQNFARYPARPLPGRAAAGAARTDDGDGDRRREPTLGALVGRVQRCPGHRLGVPGQRHGQLRRIGDVPHVDRQERVDPGRYTFEVRACNSHGCGAWGAAAATVTDPAAEPQARSPSVRLTKGRNAQGVDSGCTSANCHFLRVELVDFEPGGYTVHCWHYAVLSAGWGHADWLSYTTSSAVSEYCIWGVPDHAVYVIVEDPATGETVRSNDAQWS